MDFTLLTNYLDSLDNEYGVKGLYCIVTKDHEVVYRHAAGHSDHALTVPMDGSEYYYFFSCTKLITMIAIMQLYEEGLVDLYDPVCKYLPEWRTMTVVNSPAFLQNMMLSPKDDEPSHIAAHQVRVIDCMSMMAGLTYNLNTDAIQKVIKENPNASTRDIVAAIAKTPLIYEPGTHYRYSLGHDVIAAVVEVISGEKFRDYLDRKVFRPLGITDLTFHPTEEQLKRFAAMYSTDFKTREFIEVPTGNNFVVTPEYDSGGAGLAGTADAYSVVSDALANGGVGRNGVRILKEETVMLFTHSVTTGDALHDFHSGGRLEYGYGLGVRVKLSPFLGKSPAGEFGWDGAAGAYTAIDPFNHISIFYTQHILGFVEVYSVVHPRIRDLVYTCLNR